ncbi:MAG: AI-2E family transporter [Candidatus Levybacteria bacterium]|nr:AI-2E family transporter [Candidatus Levybacteria bacterium]
MAIRLRTIFFIALGLITLLFLYIEREILIPFILAAVFAYVLNPIVDFFSDKIKLPRTLIIIVIYVAIITGIVSLGTIITRQVLHESKELTKFTANITSMTREQINLLPSWLKPEVENILSSLDLGKSRFLSPSSIINIFPRALSGIISTIIFLFSAFYFLKEGKKIFDRFLYYLPKEYRIEAEIILRKINNVFGGYLRGILILMFVVFALTYIALTVLGVRFALILAIFSGFAEIVPFIGPITAGVVASFTVFLNGTSNFPLTPIQGALLTALIYFLIQQFQNYLVSPHIMGRMVGLHPVVILFSVIAGEHLWGPMGFVLAVPTAATIKILLEFYLDKINSKDYSAKRS